MDGAFEEATRYLFEAKLGLVHVPTPGSEHADGVLDFGEAISSAFLRATRAGTPPPPGRSRSATPQWRLPPAKCSPTPRCA